jgi:deazaflavin-dependent oxidoreductase (nitroreductase family)
LKTATGASRRTIASYSTYAEAERAVDWLADHGFAAPDEEDRDRAYVFATYAGSDRNPAWFGNLVAHPGDVVVEIGREPARASAEVLPEGQRTSIYAAQASRYSGFAAYQEKTERRIPVVALTLHREGDS